MARHTTETASLEDPMYQAEHWLAWLFGAIAIVFGVIGVLRGFGMIGNVSTSASGVTPTGVSELWDGVVWLLPAIAAAFLSMSFHRNDHHMMRDPELLADRQEGFWKVEHWFSWLLAFGSIVFGILGMLVSFNLVGRVDTQMDGLPWLFASIGTGILMNTFHSVRHHQMAYENDYIVRLVEQRVSAGGTPRTIVRETETERS